jgi:DNA-binding CsgD family transcriptional regulator
LDAGTTALETLVGREAELAAIEKFLNDLPAGPSALSIEGEAGIGKTTLWLNARRAADARGYRVLQARPAESEARLSYAALADLVGDAFDETRGTLPMPQERALANSLLRAATAEPADARTTATAFVNVVSTLARDRPVLVAVDDVQWLDPASEQALEFAVRRLQPQVGVVVTRRAAGSGVAPLGLERALADDRLQRLVVTPLSLAALHHVIASRLRISLTRATLVRVAETSGGNPFYALEIARQFTGDAATRAADAPLPLPPSIQKLAADRVDDLSPLAKHAVLVAAALARPTLQIIADALAPEADGLRAVVEAEDAGVLLTEAGRVRFSHPLLASGVYGSASDARRRQLHRRLAELVRDPEERARHLAQSVLEPDETTAREIEDGARRAALSGAQHAASELFAASVRLTPSDQSDALARRLRGAAAALLSLGDVAGARLDAERAVRASSVPTVRAEGLSLLADIEWADGAIDVAMEHLERAVANASGNPELQGRALAHLSFVAPDPQRAIEFADAATRLLREEREPALVAWALINRFIKAPEAGCRERRELLERGLELEARAGMSRRAGPGALPHPLPLLWFQCTDDFDAARSRHAVEDQWYRDVGEERSRAERLAWLALVELRAGRWALAEQHIETSCNTIEEFEVRGPSALPFAWRAFVDAYCGRVDRARATIVPLIEAAEQTNAAPWTVHLLSVLGFVEFVAGEHAAADRALTRMREQLDANAAKETLLDRSEPFHIESLIALGEPERARETLARLEERGRTLPRLWIDVTLPRARALVLAAEGDVPAALAALDELDLAAASRLPFELAWAGLVKGRLYRRLKQRRSAAEAFREALAVFERLGAPTWAEQTGSELARVGPRRRAPDELTATELRVAELIVAGMTNREVAKAAFMSTKTVEANLARVYRKLGIRSRAELGGRMRDTFETPA